MKPSVPAGGGLLGKQVPVIYTILAAVLAAALTWTVTFLRDTRESKTDTITTVSCPSSMLQYRMGSYELIKPLLLTDVNSEAEYLNDLKATITNEFAQFKSTGEIIDASAYIRNLNNGSWTGVNTGQTYAPGSMLKVPILITYLKMAEKSPGLFDRELYLDPRYQPNKEQIFDSKHLTPGKYKIRELVNSMIINSDNYATMLLNLNIDAAEFTKLFTELGMSPPDPQANSFPLTVTEMSRFMRVLYSATYLTKEDSEYAMELLSKSTFRDGFLKAIPPDVKVAHKFGESGDGKISQLHETAIIYYGQNPYLLIVMTKGNNMQNLPKVLTDISRLTFEKFKSLN